MDRRKFIKTSCLACLSGLAVSTILESCVTTSHVNGDIVDSDLVIPKDSFQNSKNGQTTYKKYLIVQHPELAFPICIYRTDESNYNALLMKCSHQGAELQAFGDKLQCPAHGSEFSQTGEALNPPAQLPLRKFPVSLDDNNIKISLK